MTDTEILDAIEKYGLAVSPSLVKRLEGEKNYWYGGVKAVSLSGFSNFVPYEDLINASTARTLVEKIVVRIGKEEKKRNESLR